MVAVDPDPDTARERAARFLGMTYSRDFTEIVDRVTVTGTAEVVTNRLRDFVQAGARHLVLLPCVDRERGSSPGSEPWWTDLLSELRGASHTPGATKA